MAIRITVCKTCGSKASTGFSICMACGCNLDENSKPESPGGSNLAKYDSSFNEEESKA